MIFADCGVKVQSQDDQGNNEDYCEGLKVDEYEFKRGFLMENPCRLEMEFVHKKNYEVKFHTLQEFSWFFR